MKHNDIGYGNCFLNSLYIWCRLGFRGKFVIRKRPGTNIPHLMVDVDGGSWHFVVDKNLLPRPFDVIWFRGRYEKVG